MKQKKKFAASMVLACAVLIGVAYAAGASRQISATLRPDITIKVDGVTKTITDSNGNAAAPIIYNGTTYLPVKSVGQLLGQDVTWDGKTNTVNITGPSTSTDSTPSTPSTPASKDLIGEAKAKELALGHAKLSASDVTFIHVELDWENGRQVYDVEFYSGAKEYDYEIDAKTGEIVSFDYDAEGYAPSQSGNVITQEAAVKLAQDRVPNATLVKIEYDFDDGRPVYEGELREGRWEYEFEIDAATGEFLKWEKDD